MPKMYSKVGNFLGVNFSQFLKIRAGKVDILFLISVCPLLQTPTSAFIIILKLEACTPGWKGSHVSSIVRKYSRQIHDIRTPNHAEITRNAHPCMHDNIVCYACIYRCDKHRILRLTRGTTQR